MIAVEDEDLQKVSCEKQGRGAADSSPQVGSPGFGWPLRHQQRYVKARHTHILHFSGTMPHVREVDSLQWAMNPRGEASVITSKHKILTRR